MQPRLHLHSLDEYERWNMTVPFNMWISSSRRTSRPSIVDAARYGVCASEIEVRVEIQTYTVRDALSLAVQVLPDKHRGACRVVPHQEHRDGDDDRWQWEW